MIRWVLPFALIAVTVTGAAMATSGATKARGGTVKTAKSTAYGVVLVGANGHTLYRYTPDRKGVSVCDSSCRTIWPPLLVKATAKPTAAAGVKAALLGTIKGPRGMRQVTYAGFPLYFFANDKRAGQMNGQGYGGIWFVVNTNGALVKKTASAATPTTTSPTTTSSGGSWG
ncbi:MAG TPA: hypothetical protein VNC40_01245 [Gaiellaceae bacterium]|nr:hypothetical protein [Gaiellaceae bacterium]